MSDGWVEGSRIYRRYHRWATVAGPSHTSGDADYTMILVFLSHEIKAAFWRW